MDSLVRVAWQNGVPYPRGGEFAGIVLPGFAFTVTDTSEVCAESPERSRIRC